MPIWNDNQKKMTNETKSKNIWQSESTTIFLQTGRVKKYPQPNLIQFSVSIARNN